MQQSGHVAVCREKNSGAAKHHSTSNKRLPQNHRPTFCAAISACWCSASRGASSVGTSSLKVCRAGGRQGENDVAAAGGRQRTATT